MRTITNILLTASLGLALGACGDDGGSGSGGDDTSGGADTGMTSPGSTGGDDSPTTTPGSTGITTTAEDTGVDSSSGGEPAGYDFDDTPPDQLSQVDRMGMPAINTAVISSKDDYNEAGPADDIAGTFVPEIVASLEGLHAALDDDLTGLTLTPCAVDDCVGQAAPLVVPDVIHIDPEDPAGFPNGRLPADPVIDVTLALVLLDLTVPGQDVLLFANLPLNPPANDLPFPAEFPYLADPH
jgi:hypothetical protein